MIRSLARRSTVGVLAGVLAIGGLTGAYALTAAQESALADPEEGNSIVVWGTEIVDGERVNTRVDIPSPEGSPFVDVASSSGVTLGLTIDGTIITSGTNQARTEVVPASLDGKTVVDIDASGNNAAAVTSDGTVTAWGSARGGFNGTPEGLTDAKSVAVDGEFALALKSDGTVYAWGASTSGALDVPDGLSGVTDIAVGDGQALAVKSDGSVVAWGENGSGESTVPAELDGQTVIDVQAGRRTSGALTAAGKIVTWGQFGGTPVPSKYESKEFVAFGMSSNGHLGLTRAGQFLSWRAFDAFTYPVPEDLQGAPIVAMTAGSTQYAAIVNATPDVEFEVSAKPSIAGTAKVGETLTATPAEFTVEPESATGQWLADGLPIADATAATLELTEAQLDKDITYRTTGVSGSTTLESVSDPVGPVAEADPAPAFEVTDKPSIAGTAKVGETLTATPAKFTVDPTVTASQWLADGERIPRATSATFVLTEAQLGKEITFRTTGINGTTVLLSDSDPVGSVVGRWVADRGCDGGDAGVCF